MKYENVYSFKTKMQKFVLFAFDRFNGLIAKNEINHVKVE